MYTLGERLRESRKKLKLTQKEVARLADLTQSTYSDLENGRSLTSSSVPVLASILQVDAYWLATGKVNEQAVKAPEQYGSVSTWTDGDPIPDGYVAVDYYADVHVSAGSGYLNGEHHAPRQFLLPTDLIRDCGVNADETNVLPVHGESMFPELKDGQLISIDTSAKKIFDGEIYAFCADGEIKIKYLFTWNEEGKGGFKAVSRNDDKTRYPDEYYSPKRIEADKVFIIGQYWWKSESRKVRR